jgi:hypothetical protein
MTNDWKHRVKLFLQRFWQPTSACMTCMPGSWAFIASSAHWANALRTGLFTGLLAVLLTFTPAARLYENRFGNAVLVGALTAIGDSYAHTSHYQVPWIEHLITGFASGVLTLLGSYLFEDRARRIRALWARVFA